jgi:hypothetical protein
MDPIMSQMNPVQMLTTYFYKIHFSINLSLLATFPVNLDAAFLSENEAEKCFQAFSELHIESYLTSPLIDH